ncbi:MAG: 4'-phosphopantetheinyl transferase family protein [Pirellulaceae bacterium]
MTTVFLWTADTDVAADALPSLQAWLSDDELKRAANYKVEHLQRRFVTGRAFLRTVLASQLNCAPQEVEFEIDPGGKPHLAGAYLGQCQFSYSRSQNWAVAAVVQGRDVGVDIELPKPMNDQASVARRIFNDRDFVEWQCLTLQQKPDWFFRAWTRKEARGKADGTGISRGPENLQVPLQPFEPGAAQLLDDGVWLLSDWDPLPDAPASLVIAVGPRRQPMTSYRDEVIPREQIRKRFAVEFPGQQDFGLTVRQFGA